jgi:hypothetical protein
VKRPIPKPTPQPSAPRHSWYRGPKGDVTDAECAELVRRYREIVAKLARADGEAAE